MLLLHEVGKIFRALKSADIPVIPLKGVCLAETVYSNIGLRQIGDVDLLVKPADLAKAIDVLRTLGYTADYLFDIESVRQFSRHMPQLSKRGGVTLELHWTITSPRDNVHFDDVALDKVWSRATPIKIDGVQVLVLSPTDLLWHLCLHASVQHRFDDIGLRAFWDMALVVRRYGDEIDWERFAQRVHHWRMANGVFLALQLMEEWTDASIPDSVLATLGTVSVDEPVMDWVCQKIWNVNVISLKSDFARLGRPRLADKFAALSDTLFPSRAVMASLYHAPANSWRILCYYPMRFKDVWVRYGQAMWRLLRRDKKLIAQMRLEARLRDYLGRN
jgi:hypothetical protein